MTASSRPRSRSSEATTVLWNPTGIAYFETRSFQPSMCCPQAGSCAAPSRQGVELVPQAPRASSMLW
jgi:hypothetical protein